MEILIALIVAILGGYGMHSHAQTHETTRDAQTAPVIAEATAPPAPTMRAEQPPAEEQASDPSGRPDGDDKPVATPSPALSVARPDAVQASITPRRAPALTVSHPTRRGVVMQFHSAIRTVGDALRYIATPINYRIIIVRDDYQETADLLARSLPQAARNGELLNIEDAMTLLVGDDAILLVDHNARLITLQRQP